MHRAAPPFQDYAGHHRTSGNNWCHRVSIPPINLSRFRMLFTGSILHFNSPIWILNDIVHLTPRSGELGKTAA